MKRKKKKGLDSFSITPPRFTFVRRIILERLFPLTIEIIDAHFLGHKKRRGKKRKILLSFISVFLTINFSTKFLSLQAEICVSYLSFIFEKKYFHMNTTTTKLSETGQIIRAQRKKLIAHLNENKIS
jgi:hypothetical protein